MRKCLKGQEQLTCQVTASRSPLSQLIIIVFTGIVVGGVWGLWEGLRHPEARTLKTRLNRILNGCTRRGPFVANTLAVIGKYRACRSVVFFLFFFFCFEQVHSF